MVKKSLLPAALDVFHFARVHYSYYNMRYSCSCKLAKEFLFKQQNDEI